MIKRLWFLLSLTWAAVFLGVNLMNGSRQWPLVLAVAVVPLLAGFALYWALAFIVLGVNPRRVRVMPRR